MDARLGQVRPAFGQRVSSPCEADFHFGGIENEGKHNALLRNLKFYTEVRAYGL
jgi:hypothetical protein